MQIYKQWFQVWNRLEGLNGLLEIYKLVAIEIKDRHVPKYLGQVVRQFAKEIIFKVYLF